MRVFLFRGLFGGLFSTGMDTLADKLSALGYEASVHRWSDRSRVENQILNDTSGSLSQGISLIGHSLGGNTASYIAESIAARGVKINYLATMDATAPKPVPSGVLADNFRSSDWRDKPVSGANEFDFPDLAHTEIDKDKRVHEKVLERISSSFSATTSHSDTVSIGGSIMNDDTTRGASIGHQSSNTHYDSQNLASIIAALAAVLNNQNSNHQVETQNPTPSNLAVTNDNLTPINGWLGKWVGNLLNGKKTGLGIAGLAAVYILPTLFPGLAPIQAIFQALGATSEQLVGAKDIAADPINTGQNLLTPIFTALGGWGILGKIEKWVENKQR